MTDSAFARMLQRVAQWVCRWPKWCVYPLVLFAAGCALYTAFGLKLDMTRNNLVGTRQGHHRVFLAYQQEFPVQEELVVLVQSPYAERSRQFIERLARRVQPQTNLFADLFYRTDLATFGQKGLLLASVKDVAEMRQNLSQYLPVLQTFTQATNLESLAGLVNQQFRTGFAGAASSSSSGTPPMIKALPFLERIITQGQQAILRPGQPVAPEMAGLLGGADPEKQSYVTLGQGRFFLLAVRPRESALTTQAIERLRQFIGETQIEVPGVGVGLTGGPVLNYDEMRQAEHDSLVASIVALIICSLIFIVAYRQVGRPLKAALCLLLGMACTMGFTALAVGRLNILTVTFAPMLIGLAIDFGIHFSTRYEEEMRNRRSGPEAVEKATMLTGQGIVTGALTTAAAFLAMALTDFRAIREMGLICGVGLLLCLAPMMTTLPALLLRGRQNLRDHQIGPLGQRRLQIENLWLQRPVWVVALTAAMCAGAALLWHRVHFDSNLLHLQSRGLASVAYEQKLVRESGSTVVFAAVIADSPSQAVEYEERLKRLPAVARVESMADNLVRDQGPILEQIRALKRELAGLHFAPIDRQTVDIRELSPTLWYLTGYLGLAADAAQLDKPDLAAQMRSLREAIDRFRKLMLSGRPEVLPQLTRYQQAFFEELHGTFAALQNQDTSGPLRAQDLPPVLRHRFIGVTGKYLVQVYPRKDMWEHANQREFVQQLQSAVPADRVTGTPVELYEYTTLLIDSYQQAALYALVAIALMVWLHFRSLASVVLALLPVAIGSAWLLGFMGLAGIPFNPANIMTLPLVVGIGVTNGIQILNRFAEERRPRIFAKSTGKAVLVSGLTALTGFGTLMLGKHQGIRSLGEVMAFGIATCMLAALTFLPALLSLLLRLGWQLDRSSLAAEPAT